MSFAMSPGIHQDGVLKEKLTYEIMTLNPWVISRVPLSWAAALGAHAFRDRLKELGYRLSEEDFPRAF